MKSAIRHIITLDGRDDRILPTIGNLLQFTTELSGIIFRVVNTFLNTFARNFYFIFNLIRKTFITFRTRG